MPLDSDDPWREMAIEKQFRSLLKLQGRGPDKPATLLYLLYGHEDDVKPEDRFWWNRIMSSLVHAWEDEWYAELLKNILWGDEDEMPMSEAMEETLDDPEQLPERVMTGYFTED